MDIDKLEAFIVIASTGSFSKASQKLFINQSTLSARIRVLEEELGVELFERPAKGKKINLSPYGTLYLPYARKIVSTFIESKQRIIDQKHSNFSTLKIGATFRIGNYFLPPIVSQFHHEFANTKIITITDTTPKIFSMVLNRHIDVGFIHDTLHNSEIENIKVTEDQTLLVFNPNMQFADPQTICKIVDETLIYYKKEGEFHDKRSFFWPLIEEYMSANNIRFHNYINVDQTEAIKGLIKQGMGISFLPTSMIQRELDTGELAGVRAIPPAPNLSIHMIYLKQKYCTEIGEFKSIALKQPLRAF